MPDRLAARADEVAFKAGDLVYRANGPVRHVYFPRSGMFSMVLIMEDGATAEVGTAGNEGFLGVPTFLGADRSPTQIICQVPGSARRLPAAVFREEADRPGPLRDLIRKYTRALLDLVSQSTACNRLHGVGERRARWLLRTHDRAGEVCGYAARAVTCGEAALAAAAADPPDAVVLDLGMPCMDGWELARRLRERATGRRPLLIAVSGWGRPEDRARSEAAGIDVHLLKPADPSELMAVLDRFRGLVAAP